MELARLMQDQPMTGLQKSVWWTEHVIRNKGAKHLRNPAVDMPLHQYYLVDVTVFITGVSVALVFVAFQVIKLFISLYRSYVKRINKRKLE